MRKESSGYIMIKKITNIILSLGFMLMLTLPFMQDHFEIFPRVESTENRKLADKPYFSLMKSDSFPFQYENYFNDHFSLRNQLIKLKSNISKNIFNQSPMPDKVIFGRDGWLYAVKDELDTYRGKHLFKQVELDMISNEMKKRKAYLDSKGIAMYFAIAPTKYSIYPEYLPVYVDRLSRLNRTDQIKGILENAGIDVLDLRESLKAVKHERMLYYKTDNHWNGLGSFVAYQSIAKKISIDFPGLPILEWTDFNIEERSRLGGNTADLINMHDDFKDTEYFVRPKIPYKAKQAKEHGYLPPAKFPFKNQYEEVFETGNDSLPDILFIRDSYGNAMMPYLTESFNRSVCIFDDWKYNTNKHIIENEKPDIVLYVVLESVWHGFMKGVDNSEFQE